MSEANFEYRMASSHQAELREKREADRISSRVLDNAHTSWRVDGRALLFTLVIVVTGILAGATAM